MGPPAIYGEEPVILMVNTSLPLPSGSALSWTSTVNVHEVPHEPENSAQLPVIVSEVTGPCTCRLVAWSKELRLPLAGPPVVLRCATKPKLAVPPVTLMTPPPVTFPGVWATSLTTLVSPGSLQAVAVAALLVSPL